MVCSGGAEPLVVLMMVKHMQLRAILNKRDGISLVEILVALAIFAIGIMTVIRVFPGGFSILKHSANATVTDRMAQAELERIQNGGGMPVGILSGTFGTDGTFTFYDTNFEDLNDHYPSDIPASTNKDVNKYRFVFEETTPIPSQELNSNMLSEASSYYYAKFSPIDISPIDNTTPRISVYSGQMNQVVLPSNLADLSNLRDVDYSIDYTNGLMYVKADDSGSRRYYISYTYGYVDSDGNKKLATVLCQPVDFNAADPAAMTNGYQSVAISFPTGIQYIYKQNITARRGFRRIPNDQSWSTDTSGGKSTAWYYEYKVVDPRRGLIAFNPAGYGQQESVGVGDGQIGSQNFTAYISYGVMDWHIIHEDKKIPTQSVPAGVSTDSDSGLNIRLSLGSIKRLDYSQEYDGSTYKGLNGNVSDMKYDILVADFDDGNVYHLATGKSGVDVTRVSDLTDGNTNEPAITVDDKGYKNGIIHFSPYFYGHSVRIYYRALGDWAVSPYRPYSIFERFTKTSTDTPVCLNHSQYYRGDNNYNSYEHEYGKLFFPKSYAGMQIELDYTYAVPQMDNTFKYYSVTGEIRKISDDPLPKTGLDLCYVDLATELNRKYESQMPSDKKVEIMQDNGDTPDVDQVRRIRGISLGVRVIRKDTGAGFRGGSWKSSDLQTCVSLSQ